MLVLLLSLYKATRSMDWFTAATNCAATLPKMHCNEPPMNRASMCNDALGPFVCLQSTELFPGMPEFKYCACMHMGQLKGVPMGSLLAGLRPDPVLADGLERLRRTM